MLIITSAVITRGFSQEQSILKMAWNVIMIIFLTRKIKQLNIIKQTVFNSGFHVLFCTIFVRKKFLMQRILYYCRQKSLPADIIYY